MATSPLFGWEEPDDVDLVKDGAAAIRTLGNAIDTSMGDLLGGTTGQVLSKNSNTNMDFTWVTSDDANAIQNTIVDAKGDLITATGSDVPARLAVGSNGETLVADSSTSTGLKWGTPISKGVGLYYEGTQSVNNTTDTTLTWNAEIWDTDNYHSTSTNPSRITIPAGLGGKYLLTGTLAYQSYGAGSRFVSVRINGAGSFYISSMTNLGGFDVSIPYAMTLVLNAGDYLQMSTYQDAGAAINVTATSRVYLQYLGA
jgi:hypothetical protein